MKLQEDKPDKFDDVSTLTPKEFIRELRHYFIESHIPSDRQLRVTEKYLSGQPKMWYKAFRYSFQTFDEFVERFLNKYWGSEVQNKIRSSLYSRRYASTMPTKYAHYFACQLSRMQSLDNLLSQRELIDALIQQYPPSTQEILIASDINDLAHFEEVLRKLDYANQEQYLNQSRKNGRVHTVAFELDNRRSQPDLQRRNERRDSGSETDRERRRSPTYAENYRGDNQREPERSQRNRDTSGDRRRGDNQYRDRNGQRRFRPYTSPRYNPRDNRERRRQNGEGYRRYDNKFYESRRQERDDYVRRFNQEQDYRRSQNAPTAPDNKQKWEGAVNQLPPLEDLNLGAASIPAQNYEMARKREQGAIPKEKKTPIFLHEKPTQ